jgi:hypothetical protein
MLLLRSHSRLSIVSTSSAGSAAGSTSRFATREGNVFRLPFAVPTGEVENAAVGKAAAAAPPSRPALAAKSGNAR